MTTKTSADYLALARIEEISQEHMSGLGFVTTHELAVVDALRAAAALAIAFEETNQMITDAPHGLSCESRPWFAGICNCWKAGL
jgi:hypothetical protein